ncbi:hypothetical protein RclHR1_14290005 [Rhizophagus clarus]|uniref:Uncharacterized protein n=1 Tax=Rhizophagus clarus TaxID=94130 RepID=A0A2Z6QDY8_9GLOM|nr:hypothetical protein RclHR1_14290005 [Rhizophagus clarus]GES96656.1 hypothetical protein RCL_jg14671.t1 [Rhizophagus clarus]
MNTSISLPDKSIRKHRYRKGYLKKQAKNLDRKEHKSNKMVSFSQINHIGLTYENYNRSINNEIKYINKNNEKRKVWFSGRTKANTKFNKFLIEDNKRNGENYNGDSALEKKKIKYILITFVYLLLLY